MTAAARLLVAVLVLVGCQPAAVVSMPAVQTEAPAAVALQCPTCPVCPVASSPSSSAPPVEVHFSPHGGCTEAVVKLIGEARSSVRVQAYGFSSAPIMAALEAARARGVAVELVLDKSDDGKAPAAKMVAMGARVFIDRRHAIQHSKVVIVDGASVETGSYNFTRAAEEHNAENCLVLRSPELAATYGAEWERHRSHADPML